MVVNRTHRRRRPGLPPRDRRRAGARDGSCPTAAAVGTSCPRRFPVRPRPCRGDGVAHVLADGSVDPAFKPQTVYLYNGNQTEPSYLTQLALAGGDPRRRRRVQPLRRAGAERAGRVRREDGEAFAGNPKAQVSGNFVRGLAVSGGAVYVAGSASRTSGGARPKTHGDWRRSTRRRDTGPRAGTRCSTGRPRRSRSAPASSTSERSFTTVGGTAHRYLAATTQTTGAATAWVPTVPDARRRGWAAAGSTVYAAGREARVRRRGLGDGCEHRLVGQEPTARLPPRLLANGVERLRRLRVVHDGLDGRGAGASERAAGGPSHTAPARRGRGASSLSAISPSLGPVTSSGPGRADAEPALCGARRRRLAAASSAGYA